MKRIFTTLTVLALFSLAQSVNALIINEVMYDLDGTDSGREWIEVYNDSGSSLDIADYKFFESNTNHSLSLDSASSIIPAGGYAVIADNVTKFKADNVSFSGILFDSAFSLNNSGEALVLKDPEGNILDEYTYDVSLGAAGDGNSLQKINGVWVASVPTPGAQNTQTQNPDPVESDPEEDEASDSSEGSPATIENKFDQIQLAVTKPDFAFTKTPVSLSAQAIGLDGQDLLYGKYFWNFGDGSSKSFDARWEGSFEHTYFYPSDYLIQVEYYPNSQTVPEVKESFVLKVVESSLVISDVGSGDDFYIELTNNSKYSTDLYGWKLRSGFVSFDFPKNTVLGSGRKIMLPPSVTGFSERDKTSLLLLNKANKVVFDYGATQRPKTEIPSKPNTKSSVSNSINKNPVTKIFSKAQEREDPDFFSLIDGEDLSADATKAEIPEKEGAKPKRDLAMAVSGAFIVFGAGAVYLVRNKKPASQPGGDFDILDE